jgi:hypothetical protein
VKTDAAERVLPMVPALHELLLADRAERGAPTHEPAFPTRNGTRQDPDNVRARLLAAARERANELLSGGRCSAEASDVPHWAHDPTLTMRVYQQVLDMGGGARDALERVLGCSPEEACAVWSERADWGLKADPGRKTPDQGSATRRLEQ